MAARIGGTIGLALLATTWIAAALPARAQAVAASRPATARAAAGAEDAARATRLREGARAWIADAGAHQRRP